MTSGIGGPRQPEQAGGVGNVSMSAVAYFKACKNTGMPTHKAVGDCIKFIFSSKASRGNLAGEVRKTLNQQASPQSALEAKNEPKFTWKNSLDKGKWMDDVRAEFQKTGIEPPTIKASPQVNIDEAPKEAARLVMEKFHSDFPGCEIEHVSYTPTHGASTQDASYGVRVRTADGEQRCISVNVQYPYDTAAKDRFNAFLAELNRLNR